MPTYQVQLFVNVPSVGSAQPVQTGIVAPTIEDAIRQAKANIIVDVIAVQRTAP